MIARLFVLIKSILLAIIGKRAESIASSVPPEFIKASDVDVTKPPPVKETKTMSKKDAGFDAAFELILKHEGGFVNDPDDPGGATKYGISNRANPIDRDGDGDVDAEDAKMITEEEAREIYHDKYWTPSFCDELPSSLALCIFDSAVNQGKNRAFKILQQSLKVKVDGKVGPQTLGAVKKKDPMRAFRDFQAYRQIFYAKLVSSKKKFKKYEYGWTRRVIETTIEATKLL
ncbi:hypothetical protein LCGC14_0145030 [marine sediment metagenome]|uniref:Uncharacterized protein n=1 Tax=marine sediment metagenome TaxID=412755 RepID=A0A0F9XH72_9ZZZZ